MVEVGGGEALSSSSYTERIAWRLPPAAVVVGGCLCRVCSEFSPVRIAMNGSLHALSLLSVCAARLLAPPIRRVCNALSLPRVCNQLAGKGKLLHRPTKANAQPRPFNNNGSHTPLRSPRPPRARAGRTARTLRAWGTTRSCCRTCARDTQQGQGLMVCSAEWVGRARSHSHRFGQAGDEHDDRHHARHDANLAASSSSSMSARVHMHSCVVKGGVLVLRHR